MAAVNKIAPTSPSRQNPSELETQIATALFDLENNSSDLKASLRPLQFVSAREVGKMAQMVNTMLTGYRLRLATERRQSSFSFPFHSSRVSTRSNRGTDAITFSILS
jgi:hypothetical protein